MDGWYGDLLDRLDDKVLIGDGCWLWAGAKTGSYGFFKMHGRGYKAHRVVYELLKGPIPEGLELDHLCRNHNCVRPDHLEPVTHRENTRRGHSAQAAQTHCKHGHELTGNNVRVRYGKRECRECFRRRDREYHERARTSKRAAS